jgi:hypothetical protein
VAFCQHTSRRHMVTTFLAHLAGRIPWTVFVFAVAGKVYCLRDGNHWALLACMALKRYSRARGSPSGSAICH